MSGRPTGDNDVDREWSEKYYGYCETCAYFHEFEPDYLGEGECHNGWVRPVWGPGPAVRAVTGWRSWCVRFKPHASVVEILALEDVTDGAG